MLNLHGLHVLGEERQNQLLQESRFGQAPQSELGVEFGYFMNWIQRAPYWFQASMAAGGSKGGSDEKDL